ncbi:DNA-binding transcriptional regulator YhcF, GntR family [Tessaracoccus bendigoensis DSM 12906]|uniref:DNA-binding transcriptional regulator YhcF, GntR family n=1 Tax=Tessaracoccus bendigoensis DSM 12906 TaxID=1123357 RepID=A0A1M6D165_9ACTN|nr:GntR family transcriptional regulator [Tessaracoccus bendigoensis]SHI67022.1 DNA-binding transcriptional regulator YhcF, GntR family [Tessaracoccus bendigoensis DSM 12906]
MEFDPSSPIWLQLVGEFTRRIAVGTWPPGDRIPGVRELALDLRVNPNTVQRALAELDRQGLSRSERTAGRFVTLDAAAIDQARVDLASEVATEYARRAQGLGMSLDAARELLGAQWRDATEGEQS